MKKAGGIIALVAGVFAFFAAIFTLVFGGLGAAFEADGSQTVVGLGWGGVVFSFIVIVLGAVVLGAKTKLPSVLLIISSIAGAVLGGAFVAICMVLALAGGALAFFGTKTIPNSDPKQKIKTAVVTLISLLFLSMIISAVWRNVDDGATQNLAENPLEDTAQSDQRTSTNQTSSSQAQQQENLCLVYSEDLQKSNIEISVLDKVEIFDRDKYATVIKAVAPYEKLTPEYPGSLLQECIADVFYYNGEKGKITFTVSELDNKKIYLAYKDITEAMSLQGAFGILEGMTKAQPKPEPEPIPEPAPELQPEPVQQELQQEIEQAKPSFDCAKASSYVEKTICGNPELAKLDRILANDYEAASEYFDVKTLRKQQLEWLSQRNQCTDEQCIKNAYIQRSGALTPELH